MSGLAGVRGSTGISSHQPAELAKGAVAGGVGRGVAGAHITQAVRARGGADNDELGVVASVSAPGGEVVELRRRLLALEVRPDREAHVGAGRRLPLAIDLRAARDVGGRTVRGGLRDLTGRVEPRRLGRCIADAGLEAQRIASAQERSGRGSLRAGPASRRRCRAEGWN